MSRRARAGGAGRGDPQRHHRVHAETKEPSQVPHAAQQHRADAHRAARPEREHAARARGRGGQSPERGPALRHDRGACRAHLCRDPAHWAQVEHCYAAGGAVRRVAARTNAELLALGHGPTKRSLDVSLGLRKNYA